MIQHLQNDSSESMEGYEGVCGNSLQSSANNKANGEAEPHGNVGAKQRRKNMQKSSLGPVKHGNSIERLPLAIQL
jgi:hypothetical protein